MHSHMQQLTVLYDCMRYDYSTLKIETILYQNAKNVHGLQKYVQNDNKNNPRAKLWGCYTSL